MQKEQIIDVLKNAQYTKKEYFGTFLWDLLSILASNMIFVSLIFLLFYLSSLFNISLDLHINLKKILLTFAIVWLFISVIIAIFFHIKTFVQINQNVRRMLNEDDK